MQEEQVLTPTRQRVPRRARSAPDAPRECSLYYIHPWLAGPLEQWDAHFERCAEMGFRAVLLAPPFATGCAGDLFLVADHHRLHEALGGGDATDRLAWLASLAASYGLELFLDLVIDRVAPECDVVETGTGYRRRGGGSAPPDPRDFDRLAFGAARIGHDPSTEVVAYWKALLAEWTDAGIVGFRCDAPTRAPSEVWRELIARARQRHAGTRFIAWLPGMSIGQAHQLSHCGFDYVTSSSWAWDFRAGWLEDETCRLASIGAPLTMAELPFAADHAAGTTVDEVAMRRALMLAASYGEAWLMPMGFEFGARSLLQARHGRAEDFRQIMADPAVDLRRAVADANRLYQSLALLKPAAMVSAPEAPVAAVWHADAAADPTIRGRLVLLNSALDRAVVQDLAPLCAALGAAPDETIDRVTLRPGEVRALVLRAPTPVRVPNDDPSAVRQAAAAPRIAIESVTPAVEGGRFAVKRTIGDRILVSADLICDGHDRLGAAVLWRALDQNDWQETPAVDLGNDRWAPGSGRRASAVIVSRSRRGSTPSAAIAMR